MKTIRICNDCSCLEAGAEQLIEEAKKITGLELGEKNDKFDLDSSVCLGGCALSPNILVDSDIEFQMDSVKLKKICE